MKAELRNIKHKHHSGVGVILGLRRKFFKQTIPSERQDNYKMTLTSGSEH